MTVPEYTENWRRYWERAYDGGRRLQLENPAANPLTRWLVADAPIVVDVEEDGIGVEREHLRDSPDAVIAAARNGFETFVEDHDLERPAHEEVGYETLAIHLTGVGLVPGADFGFEDPVEDANSLTRIANVRVVDDPRVELRAGTSTYRCPLGHETTLRQPLYRTWSIGTCGDPECSNDVTLDDTRTRGRRVVRFTVERDGLELPGVAAGRYARPTDHAARFAAATRLEMTGIPRLVTDANGAVTPTYELLHAEQM